MLLTVFLCFLLLPGCTKSEPKQYTHGYPGAAQAQNNDQAQTPYYVGLIEEYRAVLAEDPNNLVALIALGNTYYDSGEWQKAIAIYEHVLSIDPRNADVRNDMGSAYRNLGQYDRALAEYHIALRFDPGHLNARYNMGIVYAYDKKDLLSAIHVWEEILRLSPNFPRAEYLRSSIAAFKQGMKREGR